MQPITKKQAHLLAFVTEFIEKNGYAPSFEEIAEAFRYRSLATVHEHVQSLVAAGRLRMKPNRARSLEIVGPEDYASTANTLKSLLAAAEGTVNRLHGRVPASDLAPLQFQIERARRAA